MKKFIGKGFNFIQINIILVFLFLSLFSSTQPAFSFTKNNSNVANTAACQHVGMLLPKNPSLSSLNLSGLNYDEQVGETFTQSFTSMAYNVTAVAPSQQRRHRTSLPAERPLRQRLLVPGRIIVQLGTLHTRHPRIHPPRRVWL